MYCIGNIDVATCYKNCWRTYGSLKLSHIFDSIDILLHISLILFVLDRGFDFSFLNYLKNQISYFLSGLQVVCN